MQNVLGMGGEKMTDLTVRFEERRDGMDCRVIVQETKTTTTNEKISAFRLAQDVNRLLSIAAGVARK